jgi:hypothetical protein
MSIYDGRFNIPQLKLPDFSRIKMPKPKDAIQIFGMIIIVILVIATILFLMTTPINLNQHINVNWKNNPLSLSNNLTENAELQLIITNNTDNTENINLSVTTESNEIIIFCPDQKFPNVAPGHKRLTTCLIRRNPKEKIYSGTYQINIKTNIGLTNTTLEVIK